MPTSASHARPNKLEPLSERIQILFEELKIASRWNHASILLAVYESEFLRRRVEADLGGRLKALGHKIQDYQVDKTRFDIPLALSQEKDRARTVYFVSGLKWGGGRGGYDAYRALNIRRELLIDHDIRAVFWLTRSEAAALPRRAPDFWAFRHRVIEFTDQPSSGKHLLALTRAKNRVAREPGNPKAWTSLGKTLRSLGRFEESISAYRKATRLGDEQPQTWKELAQVYQDAGRESESDQALRKFRRLAKP